MPNCKDCYFYHTGVEEHPRTGLPCGTMDWCNNLNIPGDLLNSYPRKGHACPFHKTEEQKLEIRDLERQWRTR